VRSVVSAKALAEDSVQFRHGGRWPSPWAPLIPRLLPSFLLPTLLERNLAVLHRGAPPIDGWVETVGPARGLFVSHWDFSAETRRVNTQRYRARRPAVSRQADLAPIFLVGEVWVNERGSGCDIR